MPSGERSQTWYPEVVELLRSSWRSDLSWEDVITLRDRLQRAMEDLRTRRGIVSAMVHCRECGVSSPGAEPKISVRALLISVRRFGIDADEAVRLRERAWKRHRARCGLDGFGRASAAAATQNGESGQQSGA